MFKDESKLWKFLNKYYIVKSSINIQEVEKQMDKSAKFIDGKFVEDKVPNITKKGAIVFSLEGPPSHLLFSQDYMIVL